MTTMATQPGTGLAVFDAKANVPAHIANFMEAEGANIAPRTTVPSLSPEGKTWTISLDGQKHKMQRKNTDGDLEPLPIFKVVVLDYNQQRGRAFYEGEYDPNNVSAPICWSDDGVAPDSSLPGPFVAGTQITPGTSRKISAACATCPNAVKGSKVIPGTNRATTACAQHRMLALLPDPALQLPVGLQKPLRLKIAMTSDWDKESLDEEQQGWLSWSRYVDWLNARNIKNTATIVTKMKFDANAAFPKIFFAAERYLEANELAVIQPMLHDPDVRKLLGGTWTPAGVDGVPKEQQTIAAPTPAAEPGTADQPVVAAAAPPPVQPAAAAAAPPAGYEMSETDPYTYDQYVTGGWTNEQLIANGKLIAQKPAGPPPAEVVPAPPPAPAAPAADVVVVGEQAATTAAPAQTADAIVVTEAQPATAASPGITAPAAVVVQEHAQATAPAPAITPQAPEPTAAAQAAAAATPDVSTNVPDSVAALLEEWK